MGKLTLRKKYCGRPGLKPQLNTALCSQTRPLPRPHGLVPPGPASPAVPAVPEAGAPLAARHLPQIPAHPPVRGARAQLRGRGALPARSASGNRPPPSPSPSLLLASGGARPAALHSYWATATSLKLTPPSYPGPR